MEPEASAAMPEQPLRTEITCGFPAPSLISPDTIASTVPSHPPTALFTPATPEPEALATMSTSASPPQPPPTPDPAPPQQNFSVPLRQCMTAMDAQLLVWVLDIGTRQIQAAAADPLGRGSRGARLAAYDTTFVCPFHADYLEELCRSLPSDKWVNWMERYGFPSLEVLQRRQDSPRMCGCKCANASRLWGLLDHCLRAERLGNARAKLDSDEEGFEETDKDLGRGYQYLAYAQLPTG